MAQVLNQKDLYGRCVRVIAFNFLHNMTTIVSTRQVHEATRTGESQICGHFAGLGWQAVNIADIELVDAKHVA